MNKIDTACANTIINYFIGKDDPISHLKVQKLLYFSVGHCLAKNNRYIVEENFQAWQFGPVLPGIYDSLKKYDDSAITELIEYNDGNCYLYKKDEVFDGIKYILDKIGSCDVWGLVEISHDKDGPWFKTVKNKGYREDIDIEEIKQYFIKNKIHE